MKYEPKGNSESVDHIDRDKLNNQRWNLRIASTRSQCINRGMHNNNTSQTQGVHFINHMEKQSPLWGAYWRDENGKTRAKTFSVKKFGYDEAKRLDIQAREEAISSLPHYREALNLDDLLYELTNIITDRKEWHFP